LFLPVGTYSVKENKILKHISQDCLAQEKDAGRLDGVKVISGEINKVRINDKTQTAQKICATYLQRKQVLPKASAEPVKYGCAVALGIRRPILTTKEGVQHKVPRYG